MVCDACKQKSKQYAHTEGKMCIVEAVLAIHSANHIWTTRPFQTNLMTIQILKHDAYRQDQVDSKFGYMVKKKKQKKRQQRLYTTSTIVITRTK